ncbi:lytic polysaccharide monooxygenase [Streptomyces sp. NPDC058612]|uniref:lytic polysaccharide monooxygenase auxiliary activity family 9 protein n=1 Tax=Streptomyces sp. NPDC058612 TaxID=3346555 RepID=UPI003667CD64
MYRRTGIGLVAAVIVISPIGMHTANAHGHTDSPPSRQQLCAQGAVPGCGPIRWEPQSVEGRKGFPETGPADGTICSGGHPQFHQLDEPRAGTGWPTTRIASGAVNDINWTITVRHSTSAFRYFITKDGWNPALPLTRQSLVLQPLLSVPFHGKQPPPTLTHQVGIPAAKTGRHMLVAVWDIADTGNAFYACSDIQL